jgi:hypothetical protein
MARTVRTKVYKFNELNDAAKQVAIEELFDINLNDDWHESTYEDAENIGLKITEFDIDRRNYCKGEFSLSAHEVAANIIRDHGEKCETYKTAQDFLDSCNHMELSEGEEYGEGKEYEEKMMELEGAFLKSLCEDYRIMLRDNYEYFTSKEAIIETIEINEYEFTKDGKLFSNK